MVNIASKRRVVTTKAKNNHRFWRFLSAKYNEGHPILSQKRQKSFHLRHSHVDTPIVDTVNQKTSSIHNDNFD